MSLLALMRREWERIASWRCSFFYLMVGVPLVYTFIFGTVYAPAVIAGVSTIVYDADNTSGSRAIVDAYRDADKFNVVGQPDSLYQFETLLRDQVAINGVYIPPHFQRNVKLGLPTNIGIFVNATNLVYGNGVIPAHYEIAASINVKIASKMAEALNMLPSEAMKIAYPVRLQYRILANPTNSYTDFMLLGLVANSMQIGTFLVAATLLCIEYRRIRKWDGTSSAAIIGIRFAYTWLVAFLVGLLVIGICHWWYQVPMLGPLWQILLLTAAFIAMFTSICFLFSAMIPDPVVASQVPMVYVMPGLLYSGMSWPREWMTGFAKFFSDLMPLTYYGGPLRDLSLRGFTPNFWGHVILMTTTAVICLALAYVCFVLHRKRLLQGGDPHANLT